MVHPPSVKRLRKGVQWTAWAFRRRLRLHGLVRPGMTAVDARPMAMSRAGLWVFGGPEGEVALRYAQSQTAEGWRTPGAGRR